MKQEERQQRSKKEIFNAALEEFGTKEYDKVTMECICNNHGISKGMMYHYYSNKDELFLLCVKDTFEKLKTYIEESSIKLFNQNTLDAIKYYFIIRENFFELHPYHKNIFERIILQPPKHLEAQIKNLHEPIVEMNRQFIKNIISNIPLRQGLNPDSVTLYLESIEPFIRYIVSRYQKSSSTDDINSMLESAREILNMMLWGVLKQ